MFYNKEKAFRFGLMMGQNNGWFFTSEEPNNEFSIAYGYVGVKFKFDDDIYIVNAANLVELLSDGLNVSEYPTHIITDLLGYFKTKYPEIETFYFSQHDI